MYATLQSLEFGQKFITPFDSEKDTEESIVKMGDGTIAYRFLGLYKTIEEAQIAIYGRAYPLNCNKV